jgi:hypothetical protein
VSATHSLLANAAEGEQRKRFALALLADTRRALIRRASRALLDLLLQTGTATADQLRELVPLPEGVNPKVFGAVFAGLAEKNLIRQFGFEPSRRPEAHRRPVGVWQLTDRAAALAWLAANPELPDLAPTALFQRGRWD